ncbi:MAG: hypothetical protein ACTSR8_16225 [Promethearchaeota archaeon]
MEPISHILTGLYIQIIVFRLFYLPYSLYITIILSIFSHIIIDVLGKLTYHTYEAHWDDFFWVFWNIFVNIIFLVLFFWMVSCNSILFIGFLFGGCSALIMDFWDWIILRPYLRRKGMEKNKEYENNWFFHRYIEKLKVLPPFIMLPDLNSNKKAAIFELIFIVILWTLIIFSPKSYVYIYL